MIQVSLVAYLSAGAFLGLAYFDYIYHLVAVVVVVHHLTASRRQTAKPSACRRPTGPVADARRRPAWAGSGAS
jgi:hypothetical protein